MQKSKQGWAFHDSKVPETNRCITQEQAQQSAGGVEVYRRSSSQFMQEVVKSRRKGQVTILQDMMHQAGDHSMHSEAQRQKHLTAEDKGKINYRGPETARQHRGREGQGCSSMAHESRLDS